MSTPLRSKRNRRQEEIKLVLAALCEFFSFTPKSNRHEHELDLLLAELFHFPLFTQEEWGCFIEGIINDHLKIRRAKTPINLPGLKQRALTRFRVLREVEALLA